MEMVLKVVEFADSLDEHASVNKMCMAKFPETIDHGKNFRLSRWRERAEKWRMKEMPE